MKPLSVMLGALLSACAIALPADAERGADQTLNVSSTGLGAERIKTVPIAKRSGDKQRVVMSLSPDEVGAIRPGDAVWAGAEVEVSVTCLERMPQCVGKLYDYSPHVKAKLVLAADADDAGGNTVPIAKAAHLRCSQELPHRNHHCVLVAEGEREIKGGDNLPCERCHVNLVLDAYHERAKGGNVLVVGTDTDSGIHQNKGMLNAGVFDPGPPPVLEPFATKNPSASRLPVGAQGSSSGGPKRVIISRRLTDLRDGEQLMIQARIRAKTGHLPYGTLLQSQLVLSEKPGSSSRGGVPAKVTSHGALISAQNGFNCTRGKSAHKSPCLVHKVAVVKFLKDARARPGRKDPGPFVPLYVNLVMRSAAQFGGQRHRAGDTVKIAKRASLEVTRFGPEYR